MDLIGISMMDSIKRGKYIVVVDCVNLARDMDLLTTMDMRESSREHILLDDYKKMQ